MKAIRLLILILGIFDVHAVFAQHVVLEDLPENSWYEAPNTKMESVFPLRNSSFWGIGGPAMVINAWGGGAYDPMENQMLLWGGGHNDYNGNELYGFQIDLFQWQRITEPTLNWSNGGDPNANGSPNARHTYNGLAYIAHAKLLFASGGSLNNTSGGCGADLTWTFDYQSKQWHNRKPAGSHGTGCGNSCAYDPNSRRVFWGDGGGLFSYDYDNNRWSKHNSDSFYYQTMAVDSKRGFLTIVGEGKVLAYDIGSGNYSRLNWTTSGENEIRNASNPGLAYDSKADRIVAWDGGAVYFLNVDTKTWTKKNPAGSPGRSQNGIFGRWQYLPRENVFVAITSADKNVHFYKNTPGKGNFSTNVENETFDARPGSMALGQNHPNPFNPATTIFFQIPLQTRVTLKVFDITGKLVQTLLDNHLAEAGRHSVQFDAANLPTGTYVYRLTTEGSTAAATGKMLLVR